MRYVTTFGATLVVIGTLAVGDAQAQLPDPGLAIELDRTALVLTDPQNDFLSPEGVTWGLVGASVTANGTVENIERLLKTAKETGFPVFVSPHYYYPTDHGWQFGGAVETMMHGVKMFDRQGALTVEGFSGSGADWLERYKPYLDDGRTIVASPHKVYGPETNDLALQLRKGGSPRSSWPACRPTSVWSRIYAGCSNRASRWRWSRTRRLRPRLRAWTATRRRWSTTGSSQAPSGRPLRPASPWNPPSKRRESPPREFLTEESQQEAGRLHSGISADLLEAGDIELPLDLMAELYAESGYSHRGRLDLVRAGAGARAEGHGGWS